MFSYCYCNNYKKPRVVKMSGIDSKNGYNFVSVNGSKLFRHRVITELFIGDVEDMCVNHIDGNKLNNNVCNLKLCTYSENHKHAYDKLNRTTPLGRNYGGGACYDKSRKKWMAYVDFGGRTYLGRYKTEREARVVSDEYRKKEVDKRSAAKKLKV